MTDKEYLSQLREVKRQQRLLQEEIDELAMKAGFGTNRRIARSISGKSCRRKMEDAVFDKVVLLRDLEENLAQQDEPERTIMRAINKVPSKVYQSVLSMRYLWCYRWEDIAVEMNYSLDNIYKPHGNALQSVKNYSCHI